MSPRPDTPLTLYADYLRSVYTTSELPIHYPKHGTKFINLAVISKEHITKEEADKFTKATLRGDVDQILRVKKPIEIEHVLTPDQGKRLKCVLVEGGPGVGKSTFSWELCKRWGEGQLFQEYSTVVLLRLRDESVQTATRLSDLFYYSDEEVQKQIVLEVIKSQGKGVLIVLDGADELPRNLLKESSVFGRLLSGIDLPLATVLVTSRPSATEQLFSKWKSRISKHIEVIGFREKDIEDYARSVLPPNDLPGFKEYLSIHPHINTMMYIPLNSAIVTEVYKHCRLSDNTTPTIVTQLYTNSLLLRYLDRHPEYQDLQCELSSFSDLPAPVLTQFKRLCEIAYKGVCSQKVVFSDLGRSFDHLGFMHSATDVYAPLRVSVSYSFLHLSIQEYLAADHISLMSSDQQTELFRSYWKEEHLVNTLRFVAGITQLKSIDSLVLKEVLLEGSRFGGLTPDTVELLYEAQDGTILSDPSSTIMFDGIRSLTPGVCVALAYCIAHSRCVWNLSQVFVLEDDEAQILARGLKDCDASRAGCIHTIENSSIRAQVFTDMPQHVLQGIKVMSTLTVKSTAECIRLAKVIPAMSSLHTLGLIIQEDTSEEAETELCHRLGQPSSLRVLTITNYSHLSVSGSALKNLLLSSHTLEELHLDTASPESITLIAEALCTNCSLKTLTLSPLFTIGLSRFNLESMRAFAAMLRVNQTLTSVSIPRCRIDSDCAQCLAEALVHNNTLEELDISSNIIGVAGANAVAEALVHNNTLEELDMSCNNMGVAGATAVAEALVHNNTLEELDMSYNIIGVAGATAVAEALVHNNTLEKLDMSHNNIGVAGATAVAEALVHNNTLKKLDMSHNNIGVAGATAVAEALVHNNTLKKLDMSFNNIGVAGATAVAEALVHNNTLEELDMSDNNIRVAGATAMAKILEKNRTIKILNLWGTDIEIEGAESLVNSLKSNHHLEQIVLPFQCDELKHFDGYRGNEERLVFSLRSK